MIVLDSSAIVAILWNEPEAGLFERALESDGCALSAFTFFETSTVLMRRSRPDTVARLERLVASVGAEVLPYDRQQAEDSRQAYLRFGKGFHPAALNLGDCVSYALAKSLDAPLLFKGADFAQTDVRAWNG